MAPVKALIFDVDGTLAETEEVHRLAFNRAFADAGLPWVWEPDFYGELLAVHGGRARLEHFIEHYAPPMAEEGRRKVAELHAAKTRLFAKLVDRRLARPRPGIERLFDDARSQGLAVVLATTSSVENAEALILANFGLDGLEKITAIVGGAGTVAPKPAPDVYLAALDRLGLSARAAIVFEDNGPGLAAATAAGIRTIVTPSRYAGGDDFSTAFAVLSHLGDTFEPYQHIAGVGDEGGTDMVTVAALQRWVDDDDDMLGLLTIGGKPVY
ncbi:HAD-IA family hydrolase [Pleomorphomonas koreensis]|uniref:HAD-IA family hydrolase n=1 Tax=Pleomorphomonas koreensis TaxID=257440 RepID=UPI0003FD9EFF|nr:HAD-IA family hydrolase [Pleomorphomonas koreensis]